MDSKTMNVVHVLNELRASGAEKMLYSAMRRFRKRGVSCGIISTGDQAGEFASSLEDIGYQVTHIPLRLSPAFPFKVFMHLRKSQLDAVHIHCERAFLVYALVARLAGIRSIIKTHHNYFQVKGFARFRRRLQRAIASAIGVNFVSITEAIKDHEQKEFNSNSSVVPNWYDESTFKPSTIDEYFRVRHELGVKENEFMILTVGNCCHQKHHDLLLNALRNIPASTPLIYFHVGDESRADQDERALARNLPSHVEVRFVGPSNEVSKYLAACDLYVMCSRFEGFSISVIEAMASGCAVLLAQSKGLVDLAAISPSVEFTELTPESLARRIQEISSWSLHRRRSAGESNFQAVNNFTSERGVDAYIKLYCKHISSRTDL